MNYEKVRGTKQDIGDLEIAVPGTIPMTDAECIQREDLISKVDRYIAPFEEIVKDGRAMIAGLRDDITTCRNLMAAAKEKVDPKKYPLHAAWVKRQNEEQERREKERDEKAIEASATAGQPLAITEDAGKPKGKRGRKKAS